MNDEAAKSRLPSAGKLTSLVSRNSKNSNPFWSSFAVELQSPPNSCKNGRMNMRNLVVVVTILVLAVGCTSQDDPYAGVEIGDDNPVVDAVFASWDNLAHYWHTR